MANKKHSCHMHSDHQGSLLEELWCHFPYAIFSVAVGLIVLSIFEFWGLMKGSATQVTQGTHLLFHSFHFLHLVFATTGALVTYSRFSNNMLRGSVVALVAAVVFCTLSDIILPHIAGNLFGVDMQFHLCFISESHNVVPFLVIGLLNGLAISKIGLSNKYISRGVHVGHILASSLAALFYLVSQGFYHWYSHMGALFSILLIAVVVPCTLADLIIPVVIAQWERE